MGEMEEILRLTGQMGEVKSSVTNLERGQQDIKRDLKADLDAKHQQNRNDIHDLRDTVQTFVNTITERINKIEIKIAIGCTIGGLLFSFAQEGVKALIAHVFGGK
jgi:hypothetical protein